MTNAMKPTPEMIMQRKIANNSIPHVMWTDAKKKAAKTVDVKLFKGGFGPSLDALNSVCKGAAEVKRYYPKLDDRTLGPVKTAHGKMSKIAGTYHRICKEQAAKATSADQKKAWGLLDAAVTSAENYFIKAMRDLK